MPSPLLIDHSEPEVLAHLISQTKIDTEVRPLNQLGYGDYLWMDAEGRMIHAERKKAVQLLSDIDACEEQLRRYIQVGDELVLIIEDVIVPTPVGMAVYNFMPDGRVSKSAAYNRPYSMLVGWLWQLSKCGITIYHTANMDATAMAIVAMYKNSQKAEHHTLRRYIKPKVRVPQFNRHIEYLMMLKGPEIGEVKATALIDRFGTFWNVIHASIEELCQVEGVGSKTANSIIKSVGREEDA